MDTTSANPFVDDVFLEGAGATIPRSVESINDGALRRLFEDVPTAGGVTVPGRGGRVALLLAPRAGFGKSHLLARVRSELGDRVQVVPLVFNRESPLEWSNVFAQLTRAWEVPVGAGEGAISALDDLARFTFATVNRLLIERGVIPCSRPSIAVRELRKNYRKLFDFSDEKQASARWFAQNFEKLLPVTSGELATLAGVRPARATYWLRALCAYAQGAADSPAAREEALRWALADPVESNAVAVGGMTLAQAPSAASSEPESKGKVRDLLRLAALHRPVVFVIDHLDAYFRDAEAGLSIAYIVTELQHMVPRELAILSLNEDVWETAFQGGLPSAFEDRLTSNVVNLKGVSAASGEELVRGRLAAAGVDPDEAGAFVDFLRIPQYFQSEGGRLVSPRVLLRYAAIHWDVFASESADERRAIAAASRAEEPPPVPAEPDPLGAEDAFPVDPAVADDAAASGSFLETDSPGPEEGDDRSVLGGSTLGAIASAVDGLVDADAPEESEPASGAGEDENPFKRLKSMLTRLRDERAAHGTAEATADPAVVGESGQPEVPGDGSVLGQFRAAQRRWEKAIDLSDLDYGKFYNLVEIAGKRFPVVRYDELVLEGYRDSPVARWAFRGNEILIGFTGSGEGGFWEKLCARVIADRGARTGLRTKLVAFETAEKRFVIPEVGGTAEVLWDVVALDRSRLAAVYAADEMLLRAQAGEIDAHPGQILGVVASELDPLWKRLTRPVADASARDAA